MAYRLCNGDPPGGAPVRYLTCVPFLPDGACAAVPDPDRPGGLILPARAGGGRTATTAWLAVPA